MLESLKEAIDRVKALPPYAVYRDKLTNTFGVVVESEAPRQTKGSDLIQTVKLVDESLADAVDLCIFCNRIDQMPRPQPGDVLELRFAAVQFYHDRPQLFAKMAPPHAFGFLLYRTPAATSEQQQEGDQAAAPRPVQLYNAGLDSRHAARRLQQLQAVQQQVLGNTCVQDAGAVYLRGIRDLTPPEQEGQRPLCVDMRVKVLAIDQRGDEVVMFVWDGTDARPIPASLQMLPSEWKGTQLALVGARRRSLPLAAQPPGLQVVQALPPLGTALPVVVQPGALTALPSVGDWVKVKVVGLLAVQGQWQAVFGKCSRLTQSQPPASFTTMYQARVAASSSSSSSQDASEWPASPQQLATSCTLPGLPRSTIRQLLLSAAARQQGPFRVRARLIGYLPQDLAAWCRAREGSGGGGAEWEWAAHLLLEDATGEVRALLLGEEASNVLGLPPHDLSHQDDVQQLQHALEYLSSMDGAGGVWMEAALTPLYAAPEQPPAAAADAGDAPPLFVLHNAACRAIQERARQTQGPDEQQRDQDQRRGGSPCDTPPQGAGAHKRQRSSDGEA